MNGQLPIAELVLRLRNGEPQAAEELFRRYAVRLTRVAEQHLSRKLAGRLDGEDVVQSVFRTFFRRTADGEFRIESSVHLWQLLVKITVLKAQGKGRYHTAARRTVAVEAAADPGWLPEAVAHEPTPAEAAILVDQIEYLLKDLPPLHCHILEHRLQGCGASEIAAKLGVSRQAVYRVLDLLQKRLLADPPENG